LEGVLQFPASPPDGLDVHASDLRQEAVAAVANPRGLQGDIPASLLLIKATEEQVHPMVKQRIGVLIGW
jgi:hypothetical protein